MSRVGWGACRATGPHIMLLLIYRSHAINSVDWSTELPKLVRHARAFNHRVGITGALGFDGRDFTQILEGPESCVEALGDRIFQDPRHKSPETITREYIDRRMFASWGMAYVDRREHSFGDLNSSALGRDGAFVSHFMFQAVLEDLKNTPII